LEEYVGERIALLEFEADFLGEVVVGVFGFPDAVDEGRSSTSAPSARRGCLSVPLKAYSGTTCQP
jgi:hypothetical protein